MYLNFTIEKLYTFNAFILNHIAKIQELQIKITILAFVFTYVATLSVFFISFYVFELLSNSDEHNIFFLN